MFCFLTSHHSLFHLSLCVLTRHLSSPIPRQTAGLTATGAACRSSPETVQERGGASMGKVSCGLWSSASVFWPCSSVRWCCFEKAPRSEVPVTLWWIKAESPSSSGANRPSRTPFRFQPHRHICLRNDDDEWGESDRSLMGVKKTLPHSWLL